MKVTIAIALGAGLLATAMSPMGASAQQYGYAPPDHHDDRAGASAYGRYGERYAGRSGAPAYGDSRYGRGAGGDGRYQQRDLRGDERGYADRRGYADEGRYAGRDGGEVGYDAGYGGDGYRSGYGGRTYDEGYGYGGSYSGYGYGGAYSDYAYEPAYGYEGGPYDGDGYDRYTGFSAPPINYRDVRRQERELAPAWRDRGYACGCNYGYGYGW